MKTMGNTIKNLTAAFIGESMARNRYTLYAKVAENEGYHQIAEIFRVTADQEREHAKWLFRLINDLKKQSSGTYDEIKVEATAPTILSTTADNLKAAIAGENYEHTTMYPEFADIAEKEGFSEIGHRLRAIAMAESHHEDRYQKLLREVEGASVFTKDQKVIWACRKCGYVHEGEAPPDVCPSCSHSKNYFEIKCEIY